jgi:uncharacterized protein
MHIRNFANDVFPIRCSKCCSVILVVVLIGLSPVTASAFDLFLGTGESGTFSHFSGRVLCRLIGNQVEDVDCTAVSASGDMDNLTNLQGGSLDMALIDSRMLHAAVKKTGHFQFLDINYDNLRLLTPLCDIPITLVVREDAAIASLDDLKGKRLNAGPPGSSQRLAMDTVLKAKNWTQDDFTLFGELPPSQSQDTMAFCHGTVQAMLHIGVHPDPSLQQLFKLCKADLVSLYDNDMGKLVNEHPAFWKTDIAADIYPAHPEALPTFGTRAMLVVSEDFDEESAYKIIDAIYNNRERLKGAHPALSLFPADVVQKSADGIQLHRGAAKYFSER